MQPEVSLSAPGPRWARPRYPRPWGPCRTGQGTCRHGPDQEPLPVPETSSTQVKAAIRFQQRPAELVALLRSARCGMMIGCAAPTGLPRCDERVRVL